MKLLQLFFVGTLLFIFSCSETSNTDAKEAVTPTVSPPEVTTKLSVEQPPVKAENKIEAIQEKKKEMSNPPDPKLAKASKEQKAKEKRAKAKARKKRKARKEAKKSKGKPQVEFKETEFDFGHISQGDEILHNFVFENTGDGDLEILKVDVTCGCTTPTYPFIPIAPGEKGTIGVAYNSTGKLGNQKPMITIVTNAKPHTYKIYLKGVVDANRVKEEAKDSIDVKGND